MKLTELQQLRSALIEINRRTGLLLYQNNGRWDMNNECDRRTVDVLVVNQQMALDALGSIDHD
jgi:hypothetical protein